MAEKTDPRELAHLKKQLAGCQLELATHQAKHEQTLKVQSALYRIAEAASAVQEMQEFYAAMHQIVAELMYAKNCIIALYDEQTDLVSFPYWVDYAGDQRPAPSLLGQHKGATDWVIQHGEVLDDASGKTAEAMRRGEMEVVGTPSKGIAAPLKAGGKTLGVILVQSCEPDISYTPEDADLLSFVAQHIAVALTRARAIEVTHQHNAELEIINSVQHGLAAQLDIQSIYDLVGDKIREIFDAQVVMISTYDQLNRTANLVYLIEKGERFYLQTGRVGYINAGQDPPLILRGGHSQQVLAPTGPGLGILEEMDYRAGETAIAPGEMLLIYSNRVKDVQDGSGAFFGGKRLLELVALPAASATELVERISASILAFRGDSPPYDDVTLLAIKRI